MLKKEKGFTLIEILIVIVVIGILAAIAIPAVRGMRDQAKMTQVEGDFKTLKTAIEGYFTRYDSYPGTAGTEYPAGESETQAWETALLNASPRLLEQELSDPFAATKGGSYGYYQTGNQNWVLWSVGPDQEADQTDDDLDWAQGTDSEGYNGLTSNDNETLTIHESESDDIVATSVPLIKD